MQHRIVPDVVRDQKISLLSPTGTVMDAVRHMAAKHVGAVIVRDKSILATGYNGSIRGLAHCDEEGHLMEEGHCVRTVHAEANAIVQAARNGVRIDSAGIYVTASPCWGCFRLIANAGIMRIVFGEFYRDPKIFEFSQKLGLELVDLSSAGGRP